MKIGIFSGSYCGRPFTEKSLFIGFFLYSVTLSLILQLYLLPILVPELHHSNGLMVSGDWIFFHDIASKLAAQMTDFGFRVWSLHPNGQGPAGILALHYWTFGVHEPYVLIPLNSFLHACSSLILYHIMQLLFSSRRSSIVASVIYLALPFSILFYAQISKEVYYNLSLLLLLYSCLAITNSILSPVGSLRLMLKKHFAHFILLLISIFLAYISRPHILLFYEWSIFLMLVFIPVVMLIRKIEPRISWSLSLVLILSVIYVIRLIPYPEVGALFKTTAFEEEKVLLADDVPAVSQGGADSVSDKPDMTAAPSAVPRVSESTKPTNKIDLDRTRIDFSKITPWESSPYLLPSIDARLEQLYSYREYFYRYTSGLTTVDRHIRLNSAFEMFMYFPSALAHGLFQPNYKFFGLTNQGQLSYFMTIAVLIMTILVVPVIFSFFAVFSERKNILIWFVWIFALFYLLYPVYAYPNIGAFMRHRYVPHMLIIGIGLYKMLSVNRFRFGK